MTNRYQAVLSATHFKCSFCQFDCTTLHGRFQSDMQVTNCKPAYQLSLAELNTVKSNQGDSPILLSLPPPHTSRKKSLYVIFWSHSPNVAPGFCLWEFRCFVITLCSCYYCEQRYESRNLGNWKCAARFFFLKNKIAWNWG